MSGSSAPVREKFETALYSLCRAVGELATYCDHAEHAERTNRAGVSSCAGVLIREAGRLAEAFDLDLCEVYASRLSSIESINVLHARGGFDGAAAALAAQTWRGLQEVQIAHDRHYHPDVFGLQRIEQLRHCALHGSKLVAALAAVLEESDGALHDFLSRRLPDMLLFGLKLFTLMGERMPQSSLDDPPFAGLGSPGSMP